MKNLLLTVLALNLFYVTFGQGVSRHDSITLQNIKDNHLIRTRVSSGPCDPETGNCYIVDFNFANVTYSGSNNQYIEFDIMAKDEIQGLIFAKGDLYIDYDAQTFGSNIVSNSSILATKGSLISSPDYLMMLTDQAANTLKMSIGHVLNPSTLNTLGLVDQQLAHIKLAIAAIGSAGNVQFDNGMMQGNADFWDNGTAADQAYQVVNTGPPVTFAPVGSCPTSTLSYSIGNPTCGPSGYTFDVLYKCDNQVPIANLGFIISWDNTQAIYAADVSPTWWSNVYSNGSTSAGYLVYPTTTDIHFVSGGRGYIQMQAYTDANFDPTDVSVQKTPSNPTTELRYANIGLSYAQNVTTTTPIIFSMAFNTSSQSGGLTVANDYGCNGTAGLSIERFNTVTTKTNQIYDILCNDAVTNLRGDVVLARAYPNPFSKQINLQYQLSNEAELSIIIEDMLGRRIYIHNMGNISPGVHFSQIDAPNDLSDGVYLVKLCTGNTITTLKIIKE